jgi:hypothetical protein
MDKFTKNSIEGMIGTPTDISGLINGTEKSFSKIAFYLYKETTMVAVLASQFYESYNPDETISSRNQAISAGLVTRISKFMTSILALLCDKKEHGEVILALNRCITESAINLKFFCEKANEKDFDDFIRSSLKPERDTRIYIKENIEKRGKELPIETRMINSIEDLFKVSGIENYEELKSIPKRKDYKELLKSVDMESEYPLFQGISSHSIHGTWVDIIKHHLEIVESGFKPKIDPIVSDARLLCPINKIVLMSIKSYINKYFSNDNEIIQAFLSRIDDLIERNDKVDSLHEDSISKIE